MLAKNIRKIDMQIQMEVKRMMISRRITTLSFKSRLCISTWPRSVTGRLHLQRPRIVASFMRFIESVPVRVPGLLLLFGPPPVEIRSKNRSMGRCQISD